MPGILLFHGGGWTGVQGSITPGTWNYVVGVNNGGTLTIYINGVANTTATSSFFFTYYPVVFRLGYSTQGPNYYYGGLLDDVRIYNRALSAAEIAAIYDAEK